MDTFQAVEAGAGGVAEDGYSPLHLSLVGFKGIRSGLGRDALSLDLEALCADAVLVALAGANGRGKSTLIDNLHPYLVMPSRAGPDGLGAFSYYDHVYLPESEKILVWRHAGVRYKTHLVFRLNGRRKTEAFLFLDDGGSWRPVRLQDGTVVDGRVESYERAVADILGPADTFFTSVFSAQGKRPLSAFKNGEIKSLLADLLGLDEIRSQGARAAETARLVKSGLAVLRAEQAQAAETSARLARQLESLGSPAAAVQAAEEAKKRAAERQVEAQARLAQLEAEAAAAEYSERRRAELRAERERYRAQEQAASRRLDEDGAGLDRRLAALHQRRANRQRQHRERLNQLQDRRVRLLHTLAQGTAVQRAVHRQELAGRVVEARAVRLARAMEAAEHADRLKDKVRQCIQDITAIEREAGQLALRNKELTERFGLTRAVPCVGTELQARCRLLDDARQARALLPNVEAQVAHLADRKRELLRQRSSAETELAKLTGAAERRNEAERRLERAQARLQALRLTAARRGEVDQAGAALEAVDKDIAAIGTEPVEETADEVTEGREIDAARQRLSAEVAQARTQASALAEGAERALAGLPAPYDIRALAAARSSKLDADCAARQGEQDYHAAIRRQEQVAVLRGHLQVALDSKDKLERRCSDVEQALSHWNLLAKSLSNDGVIALDIDDAGPTFATLANDLLLACYGPRFTLEVCTQTATAKGELREDFDVLVHDGLRDESKSLKLVSGGERVWINECLTRAIALYLARNTGRRYGTLFADEADGPLDAAHKRMFLAMKREVLRLGNYEREFYVSQTPELTAMADCVIDLDALAQERSMRAVLMD